MKKNLAKRLVAVLVICAMLMSGVCMVIANAEEDVEYRVMFANGGASAYEQMDPASSAVYGMADGEIVMACAVNADWWITESGCYIMNSDLRYEQYPAAPAEEPVVEEPVVEEPVAEEPVYEEPAYEEPAYEEPAYEAPVEEPVYVEPAPAPAAEEPVVEEPVVEEPVAEEPVVEEPTAEEPVAEEPVAEEPVAEEPAVEEPADEEPSVEESAEEEPAVEEPVIDDEETEEEVEEDLVNLDEYETALGIENVLSGKDLITEENLPENTILMAEILDELDENRQIAIHMGYEGSALHFGDTASLYAVLKGYEDCVFTVQWQESIDNENWTDIESANDLTYNVEVTRENYTHYWRIVINIKAVEVPDEMLNS